MVEHQEAELIERCRQGDDQAFAALVMRYQKPIYNLALRITHQNVTAEEVTQVTFVKAFEKLDSYKSEFPFFSWLYRIALNEAINEYRRARRRSALDTTRMAYEADTSFELADAIQEALMLLRPDDRALIILRHFQNLGYADIAFIMKLSEGRVKSRLFKARHALKRHLIQMGITHE